MSIDGRGIDDRIGHGRSDAVIAQAEFGGDRRRMPPGVLADPLEQERTIGEDDRGLRAFEVAGAVEQGVEELLRTNRAVSNLKAWMHGTDSAGKLPDSN